MHDVISQKVTAITQLSSSVTGAELFRLAQEQVGN